MLVLLERRLSIAIRAPSWHRGPGREGRLTRVCSHQWIQPGAATITALLSPFHGCRSISWKCAVKDRRSHERDLGILLGQAQLSASALSMLASSKPKTRQYALARDNNSRRVDARDLGRTGTPELTSQTDSILTSQTTPQQEFRILQLLAVPKFAPEWSSSPTRHRAKWRCRKPLEPS